jgi:glycosyltransferase involved in cell wall biosynthesis
MPLRVIVVSSQSSDSGSNLRGRYIAKAIEKAGAKVEFVNGVKAMPWMFDYVVSLFTYFRILFIPCDVIIGLKPYPNITLVMMIKKLLGSVTVIDIDDLDFGYRSGFISQLSRNLQLPFPQHFSLVTYHTEKLRPFLRNTFQVEESKLFKLPQGVDLDTFYPRDVSPLKAEFCTKHAIPGQKLVVYAGHLNVASDLDALFEIIKLAHEKFPGFRFIVIGGGPLEKKFHALAKRMGLEEQTIFTGYLVPKDVVQYLLMGDAAIVYYKDREVNYFRESMKLREMLALGLKVVCNDVGDLRNFQDYTYQVKTDLQAASDMLVKVLTTKGDGREKKGLKFIQENMDWDKIGRGLWDRIVGMVEHRG